MWAGMAFMGEGMGGDLGSCRAVVHKDGDCGTLSGESYRGFHSGCGGFPQ